MEHDVSASAAPKPHSEKISGAASASAASRIDCSRNVDVSATGNKGHAATTTTTTDEFSAFVELICSRAPDQRGEQGGIRNRGAAIRGASIPASIASGRSRRGTAGAPTRSVILYQRGSAGVNDAAARTAQCAMRAHIQRSFDREPIIGYESDRTSGRFRGVANAQRDAIRNVDRSISDDTDRRTTGLIHDTAGAVRVEIRIETRKIRDRERSLCSRAVARVGNVARCNVCAVRARAIDTARHTLLRMRHAVGVANVQHAVHTRHRVRRARLAPVSLGAAASRTARRFIVAAGRIAGDLVVLIARDELAGGTANGETLVRTATDSPSVSQ